MAWFAFQDCTFELPGKYYYVHARTFKAATKRLEHHKVRSRLTERNIQPVNDKQPLEFLMSAQHRFGLHASVVFKDD